MLPWVCSAIDHRRRQNVVRTSVTHSAIASCATFLFLQHFDVICDLLLNRRTATWNLFVKLTCFWTELSDPSIEYAVYFNREQGCCSGESTRLPPIWPGFDSQTWGHMWLSLLVLYSAPRGFSSGSAPVCPSPQKASYHLIWVDYCIVFPKGHFWVRVCLLLKASLSAKFLLRKFVFIHM